MSKQDDAIANLRFIDDKSDFGLLFHHMLVLGFLSSIRTDNETNIPQNISTADNQGTAKNPS